jgi:uncharacterized membrane protein YqaE (UPF0057 family)
MKSILGISLACLFLASCSSFKDGFNKQRYTNFKNNYKHTQKTETSARANQEKETVSIKSTETSSNNNSVSTTENTINYTPLSLTKNIITVSKNTVVENTVVTHEVNKQEIKKSKRHGYFYKLLTKENKSAADKVLVIILCIFIPPLAVWLVHGISDKFWIDLILTLLFFLPGIIYALIVCL